MPYIRDFKDTALGTFAAVTGNQYLWPANLTGDVILLMLSLDGTVVPNLPTGYTDIQNQVGAAQAFRLCYRVTLADNEVAPDLAVATLNEWHIIAIAIDGADTSDVINVSGERTTTDSAAPFTWAHGLSTDEDDVLVFHFINSDTGLALTSPNATFQNLVTSDATANGASCAYGYVDTAAIPQLAWTGRANDDTTACLVGINDDGNNYRSGYADPTSVGQLITALGGTSLIESDTNPISLTFNAIGMRAFSQVWSFNGTSTYTDETTDMLDVGTSDVTLTNATGACLYLGYDYTFGSMVIDVATAQVGANYVWEYYNGSTWTTLTVLGTNFTQVTWRTMYWTTPTDWATTSINSVSKYYIRYRQTGVITTTPILDQGFAGGNITVFDAALNAADCGVNPYNDALSLTPGTSATTFSFCGSERQFGSSKDLDTGILILHHKSALPRDYAVDVSINNVTYPVTTIPTSYSEAGFIVVFADSDGDYEAYSIASRGAAGMNIVDWNIAAIGWNDGALPYALIIQSGGSLNKSAITRALFLPHGTGGAMGAHVSALSIVSEFVLSGGSSVQPVNFTWFQQCVNKAFGDNLLVYGLGTYQRVYCPIQIGGVVNTYVVIDGYTFKMPEQYDGKEYLDWNMNDNIAGWTFYGLGASDHFEFTDCRFESDSKPFRWEFDASHSGSAVIDFTGTTVKGATVTLRSTSNLDYVTFISCPTFTLNSAELDSCDFLDTKISAASPADAADIVDCSFVSGGSGHAIEIGGTAADFTLTGCSFTGYSGTSTDAAIYVNIATGSMTISLSGCSGTITVRTAGCTVYTVVDPVTYTWTAKDAQTDAVIENAYALVIAGTSFLGGSSVGITASGTTATVSHTGHGFSTGNKVRIRGATQTDYNGVWTITVTGVDAYTYTMRGSPSSPATGTIVSALVIVEGYTDALGEISDTRSWSADRTFVGRFYKGTYAPTYKAQNTSGTIDSAAGGAANVPMTGDD